MIKPIDEVLINVFYEWCDAHNWPRLPEVLLPKRRYMAFVGEKPIITGFLYKDETSAFSMLEWTVAKPDSNHEERTEAFKELISFIRNEAKIIGAKVVFTTTNNSNLEKRLIDNGFKLTENSMTHLLMEV